MKRGLSGYLERGGFLVREVVEPLGPIWTTADRSGGARFVRSAERARRRGLIALVERRPSGAEVYRARTPEEREAARRALGLALRDALAGEAR